MSARTCSDCPSPITRQSKTGRCQPCANRRLQADPEYRRRRRAGLDAHFAQPGKREAQGRILAEGRAAWLSGPPDEARQRLSEHGRYLVRVYLSRPEVKARAHSPEARARRVATYIERRMGWCPVPLRARYHDLIRGKHFTAAEARRIIEAEIPGTVEHGRRVVASHQLAAQLRHERDQAQAY